MFKQQVYIFSLFCIIFTLASSLVLSPLVPLSFGKLLADGFIHSFVFSGISFFVWQTVNYGNYSALTFYQRIINYSAIGILAIVLWLAISYGLFYWIFGEESSLLIISSVRVKGSIGILMYLLLIQYFHFRSADELSIDTEDSLEEKAEETVKESRENEILERIAVKHGQKISVVPVSEIIYLQADGDYVKIHTNQGKFLKEETMKYFQEHLPVKQFVRVHRSYIVNVEMIQRVEVYEKQNQLIILKNGEKLKASSVGFKQLKLTLNL